MIRTRGNSIQLGLNSDRELSFNRDRERQLSDSSELERFGKELAKDGIWQVPIEERFKGWEGLGLKEKDKTTNNEQKES